LAFSAFHHYSGVADCGNISTDDHHYIRENNMIKQWRCRCG